METCRRSRAGSSLRLFNSHSEACCHKMPRGRSCGELGSTALSGSFRLMQKSSRKLGTYRVTTLPEMRMIAGFDTFPSKNANPLGPHRTIRLWIEGKRVIQVG